MIPERLNRSLLVVVLSAAIFACVAHADDKQSVVSAPESRIIAPPNKYAFPNVTYTYSVQWGLLHAGTSTVKLEANRTGLRVTATADSAGMPDKLFRVRDLFNADVNSQSFCTRQITKHNEEGSRRRDYKIVFDYPARKSRTDITDLKTSGTKHADADIPDCVTDVISGFFYVASLPLNPGYSQVFPVNDNGRMSDARLSVEGKEQIKNPAGAFDTLRVKIEPVAGAMKGKGTLWVWFTDDARHDPVQMKSKLGFATFTFQLQKMEPPPASH